MLIFLYNCVLYKLITNKKMEKTLLSNLVDRAKKKGATTIKANYTTYERPRSLMYRGHRKKYTPDVVAIQGNKRDLYSIEDKFSKKIIPELVSKWILFSLEARKNRGDFYIAVPESKEELCQELITSKQISAQLIAV